jgi:uncharacterized DUF497 family protein
MADLPAFVSALEGFEWDRGNTAKNVLGHAVSQAEAEEIFFHTPFLLFDDPSHSATEPRYVALGSTSAGRLLTAAFTVRGKRIRIISVRDMSRKERRTYEQAR